MASRTWRPPARVLAVVAGAFVGVALGATASAVPITGSVQIPRDFAPATTEREEGPAPFYWEEWNGALDPRPRRLDIAREIAVVLTGEGESPGSAFQLAGGALMPSTMVARAGDTLRIANTDGCAHELFAEEVEGFAAMQTAPGNARTVSLRGPGQFVIGDKLYSHVTGYLHVIPDLVARAEVQADGRFSFGEVPPGNYTLKIFYRDRMVHSVAVELSDQRELAIEPISLNLERRDQ